MKRPVELPPILTGGEEHQIRQLRDYLIRLAQQLNEEEDSPGGGNVRTADNRGEGNHA